MGNQVITQTSIRARMQGCMTLIENLSARAPVATKCEFTSVFKNGGNPNLKNQLTEGEDGASSCPEAFCRWNDRDL
jgi:hypothetical protein